MEELIREWKNEIRRDVEHIGKVKMNILKMDNDYKTFEKIMAWINTAEEVGIQSTVKNFNSINLRELDNILFNTDTPLLIVSKNDKCFKKIFEYVRGMKAAEDYYKTSAEANAVIRYINHKTDITGRRFAVLSTDERLKNVIKNMLKFENVTIVDQRIADTVINVFDAEGKASALKDYCKAENINKNYLLFPLEEKGSCYEELLILGALENIVSQNYENIVKNIYGEDEYDD